MQQKVEKSHLAGLPEAERQARIDLAAIHRIAVVHGFHEGIFNHLTLAVPGRKDRYYQIPFGMHWSEVTASCLMEVGYDGKVLAGEGEVERSAYCIHMPMHRDVPHAACVLHTHMPYASALTRLADQRLLPIGQTEVGMMRHIAYDETYNGLAHDVEEGERLGRVLGDKKVLFMANHGVTVVGKTVAEAYDRLYYVERAAQVQVLAMSTGKPLRVLSQEIVDKTWSEYGKSYYKPPTPAERHLAALKRMLERMGHGDYAS